MARKASIAKAKRLQRAHDRALELGKKPTKPTRVYSRCEICGRPRGVL